MMMSAMTTSILVGSSSKPPLVNLVKAVFSPLMTLSLILTIFPSPLKAISCGLSTGIAPVPLITEPRKGRRQDLAAAIKLIGLLSTVIRS